MDALSGSLVVFGLMALFLGAGVWLVYRQALVGGLAAVVATALAAVVAGLVAQPLARRVQVPALALTSAAIVSLVPGLALYRAILRMMGPSPDSGNITYGIVGLIGALGLGDAIAIGVALGTLLSRPAGRTVHRRQRPGTARQGRGLG